MKKWQCTVCSYIYTGDEPPEKCPICGANRSRFAEITSEQQDIEPNTTESITKSGGSKFSYFYNILVEQMVKHHVHPISVHVPSVCDIPCFRYFIQSQ